jgi:hypothetical protein
MKKRSRLLSLMNKLTEDYELLSVPTQDGVRLGLPIEGLIVNVVFHFSDDESSYEYGAAIQEIEPTNSSEVASRILKNQPLRGITERIIGNKLVILGNRENVNMLTDEQVVAMFMEDIARISSYVKIMKPQME